MAGIIIAKLHPRTERHDEVERNVDNRGEYLTAGSLNDKKQLSSTCLYSYKLRKLTTDDERYVIPIDGSKHSREGNHTTKDESPVKEEHSDFNCGNVGSM